MTLIKSISGIRGIVGEDLTPTELVRYSTAYARWLGSHNKDKRLRVIIGRDARPSGEMVSKVVAGTLMACGVDVIDAGLVTTPTLEMAVTDSGVDGGIIITASHNPVQWNALKLLNEKGEFLSARDGDSLMDYAEKDDFTFPDHVKIGSYSLQTDQLAKHIRKITDLPLVDTDAIRNRDFKVAFDAVNSVGGTAIPEILSALGVSRIMPLNDTPDGNFAHNPEPLPEHLSDLSRLVKESGSDVGFVVDPDVDRLAIVCENGEFFGEEYTLVAVADYILKHTPGNTVSNLSSSRALKDVTERYGGQYFAAAVGEVNVVEMMKECKAVIGGEGNGGVIYPDLHYGRDALAGIALFMTSLARKGTSCSALRATLPDYHISKNKLTLKPNSELDQLFNVVRNAFEDYPVNEADGIKVDFTEGWVHLRASNTEPILRLYSEGRTPEAAQNYARLVIQEISSFVC